MPTYFDTLQRNFKDVSVDANQEIDTTQFLEAAEGVVKMFDLLESAAFGVVQSDMTGNITKIRNRQLENPDAGKTLQMIVLGEAAGSKKTATQGLLWLTRGLHFTAVAMRRNITNKDEELSSSFNKAYSETLSKYHSMLVRPVFKLAMKACPWRKAFYEKLGDDLATVEQQLDEWITALEKIVKIIQDFLESGNYAKGL